jgi:hypothetical protein
MANENTNPLVAYAEARIAAWQAVLASVRSALTLDSGGTVDGINAALPQNGDLGQPMDLPDGAFYGKSVPACIELYLSAVKKKKTNKEIAAALKEGGVESNASTFSNTVTAALFKLKTDGTVLRFKDGWGLSAWYPANIRGSLGATPKKSGAKKKGKKSKAKASSVVTAKLDSAKVTEIAKPEENMESRILKFFKANHRELPASEIATALGVKIQTAHLMLGKLTHQGKVEKLSTGNFKVLGAAAS